MALYLYEHPASRIWYIRGSHHGVVVDESARTRIRRDAEGVKERREREIYDEVVLGRPRDRAFAEAAIGYMKSGGERKPLQAILTAKVNVDGKSEVFGHLLLKRIDQAVLADLATTLYPRGAPSTKNRHVYTPVSAVLHWAEEQRGWGFVAGRMRRPKQPKGRVDWRRPQEIEWWLKRAGHATGLLTAYVGTGARLTELIALDWEDVTPGGHRLTLWEEDTKAGAARGVDLQLRVRAALGARPDDGGRVFRRLDGTPWSEASLGFSKLLDRITIGEAREAARDIERDELDACRRMARAAKERDARLASSARARAILEAVTKRENIPWIHPHVFRHTWATWAYAVTRDMPWVMSQGGWASTELAMRYVHVGTLDLAEDVRAHGWEIRSTPENRPPALPAPDAR